MIDRDHALCVRKQAALVGIARSTVYYLPRPVSAEDLALMKQIDALHTELPFAGARMLRRLLAANGSKVGRRHVRPRVIPPEGAIMMVAEACSLAWCLPPSGHLLNTTMRRHTVSLSSVTPAALREY
jgi:hypothetical protein